MDVVTRQPDPVHAPRRGRGRVGVGRADPRRAGRAPTTARGPTRPAPAAPAPPPRSSSATADPGRRSDHEHHVPRPPRRRRGHRPHRRAQPRRAARPTSARIDAAAEHGPGPRPAGLRQPRARLRRLRRARRARPPARHGASRNVAIVSAYNDMLSAHQPFETLPARCSRRPCMRAGGIAQFAGGVPAMCDGITQGRDGMELSLFSRDVIAMSTAIALSHDMFDAALMLGVCDKIVPGLLIGALSFGHLPTVFVPAGPMTSGPAERREGRGSASCTPRARSAARSCSRPRPRRTTRPAPARSTAPRTPTSC